MINKTVLKQILASKHIQGRVITYEESDTITDDFGTIEVMPLWKWILGQ